MEDLRDLLLSAMIQINALIKRVKVLEEYTLDETPSLEAFKALEKRLDGDLEALKENRAIKGLIDYVDLFGLDSDDLTRTLENMHCAALGPAEVVGTVDNLEERLSNVEARHVYESEFTLNERLSNVEAHYVHESELARHLEGLKAEITNHADLKITNHADLKTDNQEVLSAVMSLELFFDTSHFMTEHEGMAFETYVNHRDLIATDYPLEVSEPREGEPLFEEARKALDIIKAHLIK